MAWVGWRCQRCNHEMRGNPRFCPVCNYTVYDPIQDYERPEWVERPESVCREGETVSAPIVFLDTETDGVQPNRKVWEVGMISRAGDAERETSFMVDIDLSTADLFGLRIGRFYDRHPLGRWLSGLDTEYPEPDDGGSFVSVFEAARRVARATHGAHIVGAVPNFDTEVLAALIRKCGLVPSWHYHLVDIEAMVVGYLHGVGKGGEIKLPWDSDEISRLVGVENSPEDEKHTAPGDVRWCRRLYNAVTAPVHRSLSGA